MIAHIFVDAENISPDVTFRAVEHFGREHTITQVDIVGKEEALSYKYRDLDPKLYRIQNCFYGKNSADTWICIEIVRAIIDEPELELIIIISSDKDFLPAIKFAVEFEKKIFMVSDGASHKTLSELLRKLKIDRKAVELRDFHSEFRPLPLKLQKFLKLFSPGTRRFFLQHVSLTRYIFVRSSSGKISEVPFVEGMGMGFFGRVARELNLIGRKVPVQKFITRNFLQIRNGRVYFCAEEELAEQEDTPPPPEDVVSKYLRENAADVRNIFVRYNGKLFEIPFVDGITLNMFGKILHKNKIIGRLASPANIATHNLLEVRDRQIFLRKEDELQTAYEKYMITAEEYFAAHAAEVRKIFISHGQKLFEVPFVNGMTLELFGRFLREKKIIGTSISMTRVAQKSLLAVRDGKIYLRDEEDLEKFCEESPVEHASNSPEVSDEKISELNVAAGLSVDDYLNEHALEIFTAEIRCDEKIYEIPFVNGMPLAIFGRLLNERGIIRGFTLPASVAEESGFIVREERIFLH